jgi:hypothetical protein
MAISKVATAPDCAVRRAEVVSMEWFTHLASKWQRVLIAVVVVLLLVGIQLLREMVKTEETEPEKEKGTGTRFLFRPVFEKIQNEPA